MGDQDPLVGSLCALTGFLGPEGSGLHVST